MWNFFVQAAPIIFLLAVGALFCVLAYFRERRLNKILEGASVSIRIWVLGGEVSRENPVYPEFLWWLKMAKRIFWYGLWMVAFWVIWTSDLSFSSSKTWEFVVFVWTIIIVLQIERRNQTKVMRMEAVPELAGQLGVLRRFKIYGGLLFLLLLGYAGWLLVSEKIKGDALHERIEKEQRKAGADARTRLGKPISL